VIERGERDGRRLLPAFRRKEIDTDLGREGPQLLDRRGPVDVAGDEQRLFLAFRHEHFRELRRGGRLARALQAGQQHDRGRRDREIERRYNRWFLRKLPSGVSLDLPMSAQLETIIQTMVARTE